MKSKIFSKAICLTLLSSLLCSCATNSGKPPVSRTKVAATVVGGVLGGLVGAAIVYGTVTAIEHAGHDPADTKTEYLETGSSGKIATSSARTEKMTSSKAAVTRSASAKPSKKSESTSFKTDRSGKFVTDASGTQYLVQ